MSSPRIPSSGSSGPVSQVSQQTSLHPGTVSDADRTTAAALKPALLALRQAGQEPPRSTGPTPTWSSADMTYRSPMGQPMIHVVLKSRPPSPGGSGSSFGALVDPTKNQYWLLTTHGLAGGEDYAGPADLPTGLHFHGEQYTA